MNISEEFSKIRFAFSKIKNEMEILTDKISSNYDDFMNHHKKLSEEVSKLSSELKFLLEKTREDKTSKIIKANPKDLSSLKHEIKLLKEEVAKSQKKHNNISSIIEDIKKNKKDIKILSDKLKTSELEIYLLKENLIEKDHEIKQIKEVSKHFFNIIDELSKTELVLLNNSR